MSKSKRGINIYSPSFKKRSKKLLTRFCYRDILIFVANEGVKRQQQVMGTKLAVGLKDRKTEKHLGLRLDHHCDKGRRAKVD